MSCVFVCSVVVLLLLLLFACDMLLCCCLCAFVYVVSFKSVVCLLLCVIECRVGDVSMCIIVLRCLFNVV